MCLVYFGGMVASEAHACGDEARGMSLPWLTAVDVRRVAPTPVPGLSQFTSDYVDLC